MSKAILDTDMKIFAHPVCTLGVLDVSPYFSAKGAKPGSLGRVLERVGRIFTDIFSEVLRAINVKVIGRARPAVEFGEESLSHRESCQRHRHVVLGSARKDHID